MNNQVTYNKLIDLFYSLAMDNKMVNDFDSGTTYNADVSKRLFPLVYVEPGTITAVKSEVRSNSINMYLYSFNIYVLDRINKGDDNFDDLLSDTNFILNSMIQNLDKHIYWNELELNIDGSTSMEPMFEITDFNLNGWMANLTLRVPNKLTPCNTPFVNPLSFTASYNGTTSDYRLMVHKVIKVSLDHKAQ